MEGPKLRFKAEDGSDFPEWEEKRLKDICCKIGSGKTPKGGQEIYQDCGVMLIRSQNVRNGFLDLTDVAYISSEVNQTMLGSTLKFNDLLLNITGASIGRCCKYNKTQQGNVNQHVCVLRIENQEDILPDFVLCYLLSDLIQNQIDLEQSGGSREGLNFQQVGNLEIKLPAKNEQQKISDFLSTIDSIIVSQKEELAAWEQRKKGIMQKLFSQEVRFKADDGSEFPEWEEKRLGEISNRVTRKNLNCETNVPLTISGSYGLIDQRLFFNKIVAAEDLSKYYLLKKGEFAYNRSSSNGYEYGAIKRLTNHDQGAVSTLYLCFSVDDDVNDDYLTWYFESGRWHKYAQTVCAEGARNHGLLNISANEFFNLPVKLPSLPEQKKIADCLSSIDEVIKKEKEELEKWQELKKGLLQQMFV